MSWVLKIVRLRQQSNCLMVVQLVFIARYRKEATGGLSDTQLRDLSDRKFLNELHDRKQAVIAY